jgi:hypothetical protein
MWTTNLQVELVEELKQMSEDEGHAYTNGYLHSLVVDMLQFLPKRKQKEYITQIRNHNGAKMIEVTNYLTGAKVLQRRDTPHSCDVRSESYFSN